MATSQEKIKIELTRLAIKFKDISLRGAKPADYKEIENAFRRLNQIYPFHSNLDEVLAAGNTSSNTLDVGGVTTDYVQLDTLATPTLQPGMFGWNDAYGTADLRLKGGNVTLQVGQETLARVVNKTGANLLESQYRVVRVRVASEGGAQGQRLAVVLAQGNNDPDSVTTLGIVTENIAVNEEGFITVFGNVSGINTTGALQGETWVDGDVLYLSPTIPGVLTKIKPTAPNHTVTMGYVVYAHAVNGKIFVKVDNGYELDELHNVYISTPADGDLLKYDHANSYWENWTPNFLTPGSDTYIHIQSAPSSVWTIAHPLLKFPSVTVVDSANNKVEGDINYVDTNNLTVTFSGSFAGKAYLN